MIRYTAVYLLSSLLCLLLASCGTFQVGRQQEPAAAPVEAAGNTAAITKETDTPPATGTVEPVLPETGLVAPAATTGTAAFEEPVAVIAATSENTVYAQKTAETVILPACYDFDSAASVVPPDTACDFSLLPGPDSGTIQVYPHAGAEMAYAGVFPEAPTLAQCAASAAFSREQEIVAPLAAMYVCYRTGTGRIGYLHFTAADLEQAGTLTLDWLTFAGEDNGDVLPAGQGLSYRSETFGFTLMLPPTWSGFHATQRDYANGSNICFTFPGSSPVCVLQIDVWHKEAWNNLEMVPEGYYLGENEAFVFASGPYAAECVQLDDFQCERYREIPGILAGFRTE